MDREQLKHIIACFKTAALAKIVLLGGKVSPSSAEWDILTGGYDPGIDCSCEGLYPAPSHVDDLSPLESCDCKAIERTTKVGEDGISKENEWNNSNLFSGKKLAYLITELVLSNADKQPPICSCIGPEKSHVLKVRAPDRRPAQFDDLDDSIYHQINPTQEQVQLCADAKYVSSGASIVDPGIIMAIAGTGNDFLIADYHEAANNKTLDILRKVGAASMAFLEICVYAEFMSDWQFDNLVTCTVQFRILGYWRDHSMSRWPSEVYGSRMTGLTVHRYIDLGLMVGVAGASLATGETINEAKFMQ